MASKLWTREENEQFKDALLMNSVFSHTRFENIAKSVGKPKAEVKKHYEEMVHDLCNIGSSAFLFSLDEMTESKAQSLVHDPYRPVWNREEHEWFLIGLNRFGKDWENISFLLTSKNVKQVAVYGHNYFEWENPIKHVLTQPMVNDVPMVDLTIQQGSQLQQQQEPMVLDIGHHA